MSYFLFISLPKYIDISDIQCVVTEKVPLWSGIILGMDNYFLSNLCKKYSEMVRKKKINSLRGGSDTQIYNFIIYEHGNIENNSQLPVLNV
jgi:hypothetical protein